MICVARGLSAHAQKVTNLQSAPKETIIDILERKKFC